VDGLTKRTEQLRMTRHEREGDRVLHLGEERQVRTTVRTPGSSLMAVEFTDGTRLTRVPRDQVWTLAP
jgi:hypothetical protein